MSGDEWPSSSMRVKFEIRQFLIGFCWCFILHHWRCGDLCEFSMFG